MDSKRQMLNEGLSTNEVASLNDAIILNAVFNPHSPFDIPEFQLKDSEDPQLTDPVSEDVKKLEIDAVNAAQDGDLILSLDLFNQLINSVPNYASGYNNRAQLLRIKGDNESAMEDLHKAISLSNGRGLSASQAYVQRGLLRKLNKDCDGSLKDFQAAADLGNAFARSQLVAMNPYAALCNQMLGEVFSRISNGEPDLV